MRSRWLLMGVLAVCGGLAASANLLSNPGLETGGWDGWIRFSESQNWRVTDWPADIHSGSYGVVNDVLASGGDEWRGIYQMITVTPGSSYDYTAWQRAANVESGISESFLEVQWLDSVGGMISQWQADHVTADQDWTLMGSTGIEAPVGAVTASVRAIVHVSGTPTDTDWHVFDDFTFAEAVPEPTTALLLGGGMLLVCLRSLRFRPRT